jgi:hypothetical protein
MSMEPAKDPETPHVNPQRVSRALRALRGSGADPMTSLGASDESLAAAIARRGFVLASIGAGVAFLAACASTPNSSRGTGSATLAGGGSAGGPGAGSGTGPGAGPWGADGDLPPKRYAQPVTPSGGTARSATAPSRPPAIATKPPRTVGPEAKPSPNSGYASGIRIPSTFDGSVIPRSAWTNFRPAAADMDRMPKVTRITVHHEGNRAFTATSVADCRARLVNVMNGEMNARVPHKDIAYHYVIDPAGRVWEARDLRYEGRHTRNNHDGNLGVMCLGNFEEQSISPAQLAALEKFLKQLQAKHKVSKKRVYTHQELSPTLCPGKDLQKRMGALRSRLA